MNGKYTEIYPKSKQKHGDSSFSIVASDAGDMLYVAGSDMERFKGEIISDPDGTYKLCPLTVENSKVIREIFDFTRPKSHKGHAITIGLGDRLGLASAGHIRTVCGLDVFPVLAQQSIRELNLTGRTYDDVLAAAVWAVFREGYTKGYGADGDHLKSHDEVKYALGCGYSMITLDCSEHIRNDYAGAPLTEIEAKYNELPKDITSTLEERYLEKNFPVDNDVTVEFKKDDLMRIVLIYLPAIEHALSVYEQLIKGKDIDFEVSIDETLSTTTPQAHFFVANELLRLGVDVRSVAPRFVGEFQKGIDYRGDVSEFERDFIIHAKIAEKFGYKVSVHSGSDKFSIFPIVGKQTGGKYHLKTAGTNWLEAVRVIAEKEPQLYRELHTFALENLPEARKYYVITCDLSKIADLNSTPDSKLPEYLNQDDARQVLHITYGLILQEKNDDGTLRFRDRIYKALHKYESEYIKGLEKHIGKHLTELGI